MACVDIKPYEGLVYKTAQMWAWAVGMDEEDLRQEIRLKIAQALTTYDGGRSKLDVKNYVFGCVRNRITDLQKSRCRRLNYGVTEIHFEAFDGQQTILGDGAENMKGREKLELEHLMRVDHDQTYGRVDDTFDLPATLTTEERHVAVLMTQEMRPTEIAMRLGFTTTEINRFIKALKEKLADWHPSKEDESLPANSIPPVAAVAA